MERVKELLNSQTPLTWMFYGDSITHGISHTFGRRDYSQHFTERLRAEIWRPMDAVLNMAISGNTTRHLLETFEQRCGRFKPDVVFLMIGMNDCCENNEITIDEFESNLHKLVDKIEEHHGLVIMQTTCPILPGTAPERTPFFDDYMEVIRKVAQVRALQLIDHTKFWREQEENKHYFWMSNAFHPNHFGHLAFAHLLFKEVGIYDEESPTCRLYIP